MNYTSTVTQKGQITLPAKLRKRLGVTSGLKVDVSVKEDYFVVKALPTLENLKGSLKSDRKVSLEDMEKTLGEQLSKNYKEKSTNK